MSQIKTEKEFRDRLDKSESYEDAYQAGQDFAETFRDLPDRKRRELRILRKKRLAELPRKDA